MLLKWLSALLAAFTVVEAHRGPITSGYEYYEWNLFSEFSATGTDACYSNTLLSCYLESTSQATNYCGARLPVYWVFRPYTSKTKYKFKKMKTPITSTRTTTTTVYTGTVPSTTVFVTVTVTVRIPERRRNEHLLWPRAPFVPAQVTNVTTPQGSALPPAMPASAPTNGTASTTTSVISLVDAVSSLSTFVPPWSAPRSRITTTSYPPLDLEPLENPPNPPPQCQYHMKKKYKKVTEIDFACFCIGVPRATINTTVGKTITSVIKEKSTTYTIVPTITKTAWYVFYTVTTFGDTTVTTTETMLDPPVQVES